ncbi:MAG: hypothetical protein N2712_04075 [Brevinematales bacterium]|nr:hypothetical protein [Brevinematales bacterium]
MKFLLVIVASMISGCVIGAMQYNFPLNPPLGVYLKQVSTNQIEIRWWGNNSENYFSGYVVFITTNSNEIYRDRNSTNQFDKPYLKGNFGDIPTVFAPVSSVTREYYYIITNLPDGSKLTTSTLYYIAVASYSSSKRVFSPLSNITNITLTN